MHNSKKYIAKSYLTNSCVSYSHPSILIYTLIHHTDRKVEGHLQPPRREKCARVYTTIYTQLDYMLTMVSSAKRNPLEWEYCPADEY